MSLNKILYSLMLLTCICLQAYTQEIHSNTVRIKVSNIPDNTSKVFIPLTIYNQDSKQEDNTVNLDVKEFLDYILKGYVYHIQKDSSNYIKGINISSTGQAVLPPNLDLDLEVINNKNSSQEKNLSINTGTIAFTSSPKYIDGFAGITHIELTANGCKNTKEKRKVNYIKVLDHNIAISEKNKYKRELACRQKNRLKSLTINILLPKDSQHKTVYIPLNLDSKSLQTNIINITDDIVVHYENNLLTISDIKSRFINKNNIKFTMEFTDNQMSANSINLGRLISQPNRQIDNITVQVLPNTITLNRKFKLKNLFELE